jgi:cytosine/adenosine deaminase-related metal-dependent hydrolase
MYNAPTTDPYLMAAVAYARMARSGIGGTVHFHVPQDVCRLEEEAIAVARAARDVGIRLAFCVPMRDRHRYAYAPDEVVLASFPPGERAAIMASFGRPVLPPHEQVALADAIAEAVGGDLVTVQYSPTGVQWCSDALLEAIADGTARSGRGVQMHLLETRRQRDFADANYPQGLVRHLDALGLLSDRLTVAHGVWLRPDEAELLAARGVTLVLNTSSNLRLGSGLAPVADFIAAGLKLAIGIDNMSIDDDDDGFRELRLARLIHGAVGQLPAWTWRSALQAATLGGARAVMQREGGARLARNHVADFAVLDFAALAADLIADDIDVLELLLVRARAEYVRRVVVDGRTIVEHGCVLGLDEAAARTELIAQARRSTDAIVSARPALDRYRAGLEAFYAGDARGGADATNS